MARFRDSFSRARPAKKIDNVIWDLSNGFVTGLSAGTQAFQFSTVGTAPTTLMRIRGEIFSYLRGTTAPATLARVTYGIILVPEGSGATVQFAPISDANAPWLLYGSGVVGYNEEVTDVIDVPQLTMFRHDIDNKAMRKIRPDVEMQLVVENTTLAGADAVDFGYQLRWLQGF